MHRGLPSEARAERATRGPSPLCVGRPIDHEGVRNPHREPVGAVPAATAAILRGRFRAIPMNQALRDMPLGQPPRTFQDLIFALQKYWADQGCVILQPYDMEMGAGTFHTATFLRAIGPEPWSAAYVQPSRRPADGRY